MQKFFGALLVTAIVATLPVLGSAQERERTKPEHPAAAQTERASAAPAERAAPVRVERAAPVRVERPVAAPIERAAPVRVERAAPVRVERAAPVRVERAAPVRVERPVAAPIERAAPVRVERAAPVRVERAAPVRVERAAPVRVERAAPVRVERAAPVRVERAAPRVERVMPIHQRARFERVAPRSQFVEVIEPRTVARPQIIEERSPTRVRSSFVQVYPRTVVYHVPQSVQVVQLPAVVQQPAYMYTSYPQMVQYSLLPSQLYSYGVRPYYAPQMAYYQPAYYNNPYYGSQPYYNDPYYASMNTCNDDDEDDQDDCNGNGYYNNAGYYDNGYNNGGYYNQYAAYPPYNVYGSPFGNAVLQGVVIANQGSSLLVLTSNFHPVIVDAGFANQFGRGAGNVAPGTMIEAMGFYQGNTFVATALN